MKILLVLVLAIYASGIGYHLRGFVDRLHEIRKPPRNAPMSQRYFLHAVLWVTIAFLVLSWPAFMVSDALEEHRLKKWW